MVPMNLARKWRSRSFDEIVGQELSVRILKNSLYLNHYLPVYLFSGQHGCGKTTTARIFASALNCEKLELFQQDPKNNSLPCLNCSSCAAMSAGNHPDFIEIDGASHTGVDNVRSIIDSANFLPLLGKRKVYLIDEAHMLSKAAFNAFLKILEEPPATVVFMLATTELYKIIETVRSRSFHLFFRSVASAALVQHLEHICKEEKIAYHKEGLQLIVQQTKGSVRDALNLLEQVRFGSDVVTKQDVITLLGHIDDETIIKTFEYVINGDQHGLMQCIQAHDVTSWNNEAFWKSLLELINACIWVSYNLAPRSFHEHKARLQELVTKTSIEQLNRCLNLLYEHELLFLRTGSPWNLLEMLLLQMSQVVSKKNIGSASSWHSSVTKGKSERTTPERNENSPAPIVQTVHSATVSDTDDMAILWKSFIEHIELFDVLLSSIFKQGTYKSFDHATNTVTVLFSKEFTFFNDMVEKSRNVWKPLLDTCMKREVIFEVSFTDAVANGAQKNSSVHNQSQSQPLDKPAFVTHQKIMPHPKKVVEKKIVSESNKNIIINDKEQWRKAHLLTSVFAGTLSEVVEGKDE